MNCERVDLYDYEENEKTDTLSIFICKNDTAEFYRYYKNFEDIILSNSDIPIIYGFRFPTKNEASLLSNYNLNNQNRILILDNNEYYTFQYLNSKIYPAGTKTKYTFVPIKSIRFKYFINDTININTEWKKEIILNL